MAAGAGTLLICPAPRVCSVCSLLLAMVWSFSPNMRKLSSSMSTSPPSLSSSPPWVCASLLS
ncbi:hypothetical protein D3C72_2049040 [compost metagenome]